MEILQHLASGFAIALTPVNVVYCFIGVFIGTLVGVLPGIGSTVSIAILIPLTVGLQPTTAILINIPGEAASVATTLDGYQMARQGRAGPALGISAIASFAAGTLSLILLMIFAVPLASYALRFGPPEYFSLMLLGLTIVVSLVGRSMAKGILAGIFGMLLATIGMEPLTGQGRFTFDNVNLMGGIDFVAVVVGLFAIPEVLDNMEGPSLEVYRAKITNLLPTRQDLADCGGAMARSGVIGFLIGVLPGSSGAVAAFMAYNVEKNVSKTPERFGAGAIQGVAAAEGANNAAVSGAMVPLLSLGIPVSAPMAVLAGAFMVHGLRPGPMLFDKNPDFVWALIASMYVGNVILLILNLPLVGLWTKLLRVPYRYLAPGILVLCLLGAYGIRSSFFDVGVAFAMGLIGYAMRKLDYPTAPVVLALILSPMLEDALRQSLTMSKGSLAIFLTRPISLTLLILTVISIVLALMSRRRGLRAAEAFAGEEK